MRWFIGIWGTFLTVVLGMALWQTWEDAHGGEAVATAQRVELQPLTVGSVTVDQPPRYAAVFVLPDGTRCEATTKVFPDLDNIAAGDTVTVHYSRWLPCDNVRRADQWHPTLAGVLTVGVGALVFSGTVFAALISRARARGNDQDATSENDGPGFETGPEDHGPAGFLRKFPGWHS
ncbi:hypothetical protein AB0K00_10240 [Dactylosporangium sp. NPDC049525]|uniref:hypothetical protein n=1 Tax=Dactylosporangium sp. NPDC049525 TaxID=3154730 RepID=UPI00341B976E